MASLTTGIDLGSGKEFDRDRIVRSKDGRLVYSKQAISIDSSNEAIDVQILPPTNSAQVSSYWNNEALPTKAIFDITTASSACAIDIGASSLLLTLRFPHISSAGVEGNYRDGTVNNEQDTASWMAAFNVIQQIFLKISDKDSSVEEFTSSNPYQHCALVKLLTEYSYDALTERSDILFPPILESTLDSTRSLSTESAARRVRWFTNYTTQYEKSIPLGMLFNAFDVPSLLTNLKKLRLEIDFNKATTWQHGTTSGSGTGVYSGYSGIVVCDVQLRIVTSRMTPIQREINISLAAKHVNENFAFLYRNTCSQPYRGAPIILGQLSHLNTISFGLNALDAAASSTGIKLVHPNQFVPLNVIADGVTYGTAINQISVSYGNDVIPSNTLNLSLARYQVRGYDFYLQYCMTMNSKSTRPMISYEQFIKCYQLFTFPIYNTMGLKLTDQSNRLILNISAASSGTPSLTMIDRNCTIITQQARVSSMYPDGSYLMLELTQ